MDKWFKDILPDKDPYHNRGRDQMRKKGGPEFECLCYPQALGYTLRFSLFSLKLNIFPFSDSFLTFSTQNHLILKYFTNFDTTQFYYKNKNKNLYCPIRVITKLPNSGQSYKGKVKTHKYITRYKQTKSVNNRKTVKTVMTLSWYRHF
jgi:hypothetical protein